MTISDELKAALFKVESIHHIHGKQCLCGFESAVSRDRTKHIMDASLEAAAPLIRAEALEEAADSLGRPDAYPNAYAKGVQLWLRARAADIREGDNNE